MMRISSAEVDGGCCTSRGWQGTPVPMATRRSATTDGYEMCTRNAGVNVSPKQCGSLCVRVGKLVLRQPLEVRQMVDEAGRLGERR
jgi:hypothetical protein